jgi:hypothetical protein
MLFWANDVRLALGASRLASTRCELTSSGGRSPGTFYFKGSGWGHGVGLCQFGSQGLAIAGYDYQDILSHYFPYSRLIRMSYDRQSSGPVAGTETPVKARAPAGARRAPRSPAGNKDKSEDTAKG